MNYKSGNVASQRFGQVRRRLGRTQGVSPAKPVKTRAPSGGRIAKPRAATAKKQAAKKVATNLKPRAAPKTMPKLEESAYGEGGKSNFQEDKGRDFMAPSDDDEQ